MKIKLFALAVFTFLLSCKTMVDQENQSKYNSIITKYTEIKEIHSQEVNDTFYVYIRLPKNYNANSDKRYPVLYLLDGDISFNMATSVVRYLQFGKDIPDLILVAPAYGTMLNDEEMNFRERDYTFSEVERFANSGGGSNYINFLEKELIPQIDSTYRTNNKRILNGYSLGGLLTIKTFLTKQYLFTDYIAGSPYLINDISNLEEKSKSLVLSSKKKIFVSFGELENTEKYSDPIYRLYKRINKIENLESKLEIFENGTHYTCPPEALAYGLKFIYNTTEIMEQK